MTQITHATGIDDLIEQHCPGGVEYRKLGEIARTIQGLRGKSKTDFDGGNARYISYRNIFSNIAVDQSYDDFVKIGEKESQNELRLGDVLITNSSESLDEVGMSSVINDEPAEPLYLNSFCFALRFNDRKIFLPDFAKYLFRSKAVRIQIRRTANGVTRYNISKSRFMEIRVPVPPLVVQEEIVRILDTFTQLEAELEAELEARESQYAWYRDSMFASMDAAIVPLGSIGTFTRGRRFTKKDEVESGLPSIHYGEIYTEYGVWTSRTVKSVRPELAQKLRFANPGDVIFAGVSETVEDVGKAVAWLGDGKVAFHDDSFAFASDLNPKYVVYATQSSLFQSQKPKYVARGKVKRLSSRGLAELGIPVPSMAVQERIVEFLDQFDGLLNNLGVGLPAEIKARRQQYEFYRDRLLSFKELSA